MSVLTSLVRTWLTRSRKPFSFVDSYDKTLPYFDCVNLGLYIHIPFCKSICNFCPYCKVLYDKELCDEYVDCLIKEIHLVGKQHEGIKRCTSLYFGGGTPALIASRLQDIMSAINEHFHITEGVGLELHPDNVNEETLRMLQDTGVTKVSIGIQSFQDKFQGVLGRNRIDAEKIKEALDRVKFETVSMDFIFALPGQTFEDLKGDLDAAFAIGANHVAIYPFIDFTFTSSKVEPLPKKKKRKLLDDITSYLLSNGCVRDSIWTFSKEKQARYSSMTRDNFLGFGCSATTLLKEQFKINTFDVKEYCQRINSQELATSLTTRFSLRQRMIYYLFWMAYSMRINAQEFERFFGVPLQKMYGFEMMLARLLRFVKKTKEGYELTLKGAFYYHYYENYYTLSYIDKMWGIMRKEAFPKHLEL